MRESVQSVQHSRLLRNPTWGEACERGYRWSVEDSAASLTMGSWARSAMRKGGLGLTTGGPDYGGTRQADNYRD